MNANADVNLFGLVLFGIVGTELRLYMLGALHGIHNRREVHQEAITHGLDDLAVMIGDRLVDNLIMNCEYPQHASFVSAHLAAEANDVGKHNGSKPASLSGPR